LKIIEKLREKSLDPTGSEPITLAFLGDSVTQGCFEIYKNSKNKIETVYDISSAYHTYIRQILCTLYPRAPINIINAGVSGGGSAAGLKRLERDVIRFSPDLVVVSFGLNDSTRGMDRLDEYVKNMTEICSALVKNGIEVIVLTTNMMVTKDDFNCTDEDMLKTNELCRNIQNNGTLDAYMQAVREVSKKCGCKLCDCYKKWKFLSENGVDTDLLLSNGINHPTRQMNYMFANSIVEIMFK